MAFCGGVWNLGCLAPAGVVLLVVLAVWPSYRRRRR